MTWRQVPELFGFVAQPAWSRVFAAKPLLLLDEASYSLYLLHAMPIVVLTYVLNLAASPHILCIMAAYLVAISLISIAVFLLIENPLRRLLRPRKRVTSAAETTRVPASTR